MATAAQQPGSVNPDGGYLSPDIRTPLEKVIPMCFHEVAVEKHSYERA